MAHDLTVFPLDWQTRQAAWEIYCAQNDPAELLRLEQLHGFDLDQALAALHAHRESIARHNEEPPLDECPF